MKKRTVSVIGGVALTLLLVACNGEDATKENEQKEDSIKESTEQHDHEVNVTNGTRVIVTYEDGIIVMNGNFEEIKRFPIGKTSLSIGNDHRHIFVKDSENNDSFTLLDIGVWNELHGDHDHPHAENPIIADYEITGEKPAHIVSHGNQTAVFYDGSGKVDVFEKLVMTEKISPEFTYEGEAHHGVAVPLEDQLVVTYKTDQDLHLPNAIKIVDKEGQDVKEITNSCTDLHGTVAIGSGQEEKLAFGCKGKIVTYDVQKEKTFDIPLPDIEARVSTIKANENSIYYLTNYKSETDESKNTNVGIVNSKTNEYTLVNIKQKYGSSMLVTANKGYVLAEDGYLYIIDLASGKVEELVEVVLPFDVEDKSTIKPSIAEVNGEIIVVDPLAKLFIKLHGDHGHVVKELDIVPHSVVSITAY